MRLLCLSFAVFCPCNTLPDAERCLPRYVRFGCFVDGVHDFDAAAFMLAPGEATTMDPQARILLQQTQVSTSHKTLSVFIQIA